MSEVTFIIAKVLNQNPLEIEAHKDKDLMAYYDASPCKTQLLKREEMAYEIAIALETYFGIELNDEAVFERAKTARDFERLVRSALK
jgi:hypothetical protein